MIPSAKLMRSVSFSCQVVHTSTDLGEHKWTVKLYSTVQYSTVQYSTVVKMDVAERRLNKYKRIGGAAVAVIFL